MNVVSLVEAEVFSLKLVQFWNPCLMGVLNNHQGFEGFLGGQPVKSSLRKKKDRFLESITLLAFGFPTFLFYLSWFPCV